MITIDILKQVRNNKLVASDIPTATASSTEKDAWISYRNSLRTFFDNLPQDFDPEKVAWPLSPAELKSEQQTAVKE